MAVLKTNDQFIRELTELFGDKFDYSQVVYKGAAVKVCLICREHGRFYKKPNSLLSKPTSHCPVCGQLRKDGYTRNMRKSLDAILSEFREIHGNRYDYSKLEYKNVDEKLVIICPVHGEFTQRYDAHKNGGVCPSCTRDKEYLASHVVNPPPKNLKYSLEDFINKATEIHNNKFDYSLVQFSNLSDTVTIICPDHGEFFQKASTHLAGRGCAMCSRPLTTMEGFLMRCKEVHGERYDYSKVNYKGGLSKIEIVCKRHGAFWQTPKQHVNQANGCPTCACGGFNSMLDGYVYLLQSDDILKVGITNKPPLRRAKEISRSALRLFDVIFQKKMSGDVCRSVEREMIGYMRGVGSCVNLVFDGSTECFTNISKQQAVNKLVEIIWEITSKD